MFDANPTTADTPGEATDALPSRCCICAHSIYPIKSDFNTSVPAVLRLSAYRSERYTPTHQTSAV